MKKLVISAAVVLFSFGMAGSAFAVDCTSAWNLVDATCSVGATVPMNIKGSKNVKMYFAPDATNKGQSYTLASVHTQGNKAFASSSGDQKIYQQAYDGVTLPTVPAAPATFGAGAIWAGWTAL